MGKKVLVGLKVFAMEELDPVKEILKKISKVGVVQEVSSVYKIKRTVQISQHIHDLRSLEFKEGLALAILLVTDRSAKELLKTLKRIEGGFSSAILHRSADINLLCYESAISMTPDLTLPHPTFHASPEEVVPCSEIWGQFLHPILRENLKTIAKGFCDEEWGEFFYQGQLLLDELDQTNEK